MARGWRVLDATSLDGEVGGTRGRFTFVSEQEGPRSAPAEDVAVLLIGGKVTLRPAALHYAAKHDVAVLFVDWRSVPYGGFFPWAEHTRVGARHRAQAELTQPRRKHAWQQLIRAKIAGQAANLAGRNDRGASHLAEMAAQVRSGDTLNAEGTAARYYWARIFESRSFSRDSNGTDAINGMLNYGYTVLRGYAIRAVLGAGLSPTLGVFHRGRSNYFNLADDLIEPFRPAIDSVVVDLGLGADLDDAEVKRAIVAAAAQPFRADGTRIPGALDDLAQQFGRFVEGDVARMTAPQWRGLVHIEAAASDAEE